MFATLANAAQLLALGVGAQTNAPIAVASVTQVDAQYQAWSSIAGYHGPHEMGQTSSQRKAKADGVLDLVLESGEGAALSPAGFVLRRFQYLPLLSGSIRQSDQPFSRCHQIVFD